MNARPDREIIKVENLHKYLGGKEVHRGINLAVDRGELVSVIGATGSGKTVLLRQIIGLLAPDAGTIRVLGEPVVSGDRSEARLLRIHWGVLFQQPALFSALNVYDNLAFPVRELRKQGVRVDEDLLRENIELKLHMVGLAADDAWKFPAELSGGMTKRASLARALMLEAELLFLDEPTSGLDPAAASELDTLLGELHEELHLTALMVTHDVYSVASLSDRIAVLADGEIVTTGTLDEVAHFEHPFITSFFQARHGEDRLRAVKSGSAP